MAPAEGNRSDQPGSRIRARRWMVRLVTLLLGAVCLTSCSRTSEEWAGELSDSDAFTRRLAAVALRDGDADSAPVWVPALIDVLRDDPDADVRAAAHQALLVQPEVSLPLLVSAFTDAGADDDGTGLLADALVAHGAPAAPALRAEASRLEAASPRFEPIITLLGRLPRSSETDAWFVSLVRNSDADGRRLALQGLAGGAGLPSEAIPAAVEALGHDDPRLRAAAVAALGSAAARDDDALDALWVANQEAPPAVAQAARTLWVRAQLLRGSGDDTARAERARSSLERDVVETMDVAVRDLRGGAGEAAAAAARAWLSLRGPSAVGPILGAFNERIPSEFLRAAAVFDRIGAPALGRLRRLLLGDDDGLAVKAALALGSWGPQASGAAPELTRALDHPLHERRLSAVWACGGVGVSDTAALDRLDALVTSGDAVTTVAAAHALANGLAQGVADGRLDASSPLMRLWTSPGAVRGALAKIAAGDEREVLGSPASMAPRVQAAGQLLQALRGD